MKIIWSRDADKDLNEIVAYFSSINEDALATEIIDNIFSSTDRLLDYPLSGRLGRMAGTRELINTNFPYIIIYEIASVDTVHILAVIHTSKLFP